jgi:hypothetical protein
MMRRAVRRQGLNEGIGFEARNAARHWRFARRTFLRQPPVQKRLFLAKIDRHAFVLPLPP